MAKPQRPSANARKVRKARKARTPQNGTADAAHVPNEAALEAKLWTVREALARAALEFWSQFLVLRMGADNDRPLDAAALARWLEIIRAVSWVESRHGTATANQGLRDPLQCGNPADAWWKELIVSGHSSHDRFITGPGGKNYWAGDLPAAAASQDGFPAAARIDALGDRTRGHNDPAFDETTSYFWGVPLLVHKTNTEPGAAGQTFTCGDMSRERLIDGAVDYNGGGVRDYRERIERALALFGGLPDTKPEGRRAVAAIVADGAARDVLDGLSDLVRHLATLPLESAQLRAAASLHVQVIDGDVQLAKPGSASAVRLSLTLVPDLPVERPESTTIQNSGDLLALLGPLLRVSVGQSGLQTKLAFEVPVEARWTPAGLALVPARPEDDAAIVLELQLTTD